MEITKRSSQAQFDKQAAHYDSQWNRWNEENIRWMLENSAASPADVALDVATGTGYTAFAFAPLVRSVVGLDVSSGMLAEATTRGEAQGIMNTTFQQGSAESLPFPDNAFSLVTCRVAAHHFISVPDFLREVQRVLQPGGRFLLADTAIPDNDAETDVWQNRVETLRDPSHARNYTPGEWLEFVKSAGLQVEAYGVKEGALPLTMRDWLKKSGCVGEVAAEVWRQFENAPAAAKQRFRIERTPDNDIAFHWMRLVLKAVKP